jgi:hypothetical protein
MIGALQWLGESHNLDLLDFADSPASIDGVGGKSHQDAKQDSDQIQRHLLQAERIREAEFRSTRWFSPRCAQDRAVPEGSNPVSEKRPCFERGVTFTL